MRNAPRMSKSILVLVLGVSDERTDCECCGRTDLKRTVALSVRSENGDESVVYYGTDCARRAFGLSASRLAEAVDASRLAADLEAATKSLRALPNAGDVAVRAARGAAHEARTALLVDYWSKDHGARVELVRRAHGVLRHAAQFR